MADEAPSERASSAGTRLFRIKEEDLVDLERILPEMADRMIFSLDNRLRTQIRRLQTIMTDIRWSYGPPREVHVIELGGDPPPSPPETPRSA